MKTVPISEDIHKKLKMKMAEGSKFKTIQEFIDSAVENELRRV